MSLIVDERDCFDTFGDGDDAFPEDRVRRRDDEGGGYRVEEDERRDVRDREGDNDGDSEVLGCAVVTDPAPRRVPPSGNVVVDGAVRTCLPRARFGSTAGDIGDGVRPCGGEEEEGGDRDRRRIGEDGGYDRGGGEAVVTREMKRAPMAGEYVEVREGAADESGDERRGRVLRRDE